MFLISTFLASASFLSATVTPPEISKVERTRMEHMIVFSYDHSHGCLKADELESLRLLAVAGNAESSYKLARHHGECENGRFHDFLFYLRLSAEQGNCDALFDFWRQQNSGMLDEFKTPGNWRERARSCATGFDEHEG